MNIITEVFLSQQHVRVWLDLINKSLIARHRENENLRFVSDYYYTVLKQHRFQITQELLEQPTLGGSGWLATGVLVEVEGVGCPELAVSLGSPGGMALAPRRDSSTLERSSNSNLLSAPHRIFCAQNDTCTNQCRWIPVEASLLMGSSQ
jgi:hypothetical protein